MLSLLPADLAGTRILDAGCGSGRYLKHSLDRGASEVIGIDLSPEMLAKAGGEVGNKARLICGNLEAIPIASGWAGITICALALGHVENLTQSLAELGRVTKEGGIILCSDFHPIGESLGWRREFRSGDTIYAVAHFAHSLEEWQQSCEALSLRITHTLEPHLDPEEISRDAKFDPRALEAPAAVVVRLQIGNLKSKIKNQKSNGI